MVTCYGFFSDFFGSHLQIYGWLCRCDTGCGSSSSSCVDSTDSRCGHTVELWDPPTASGKLGMSAGSSRFKEQILDITISAAILVVFNHNRAFYFLEQECIPVGCTPPPSVAARGGGRSLSLSQIPLPFRHPLTETPLSQRLSPPRKNMGPDNQAGSDIIHSPPPPTPGQTPVKHYLSPYFVGRP